MMAVGGRRASRKGQESSQEKGDIGAGFCRHEGATGGFCTVRRDEEGASSKRAKHAAACIALEDAIRYAESQPETTHPAHGLQMPPDGNPEMDWGRI
jgi:hypothetical protein